MRTQYCRYVVATTGLGNDVMCYENGIPGVSKKPITIVGKYDALRATILKVSLQLHVDKKCKVFDIMGRVVEPERIAPGVYFVETDNNEKSG